MFVLIFQHPDGALDFHGPFPSEQRAESYVKAANRDYGNKLRYTIKPMIAPFAVMTKVIWRE